MGKLDLEKIRFVFNHNNIDYCIVNIIIEGCNRTLLDINYSLFYDDVPEDVKFYIM